MERVKETVAKKIGEHSAVWALVMSIGYSLGGDDVRAFAADIVKDEVNKEIKAELDSLKASQDKQQESVNNLSVEQKVLAEQVKAGNEKMDMMIELLRGQR